MKIVFLFLVLCAVAATAPAWRAWSASSSVSRTGNNLAHAGFPGWDTAPISPTWQQQPLGNREARFTRDFPGVTGLFTADGRTYVVRWLERPTRKLHPAADCLRALGYDITPCPIRQQADGTLWSAFEAVRGPDHLRVHERISGADGRSWTDISTWFWHAALGRAEGPWWVVTELIVVP
ncbi:MAG: hypothetical protein ABW223_02900 [Rariglobus sp.]